MTELQIKNYIIVEVAYALPEKQTLLAIDFEEGLTVKDAIIQSAILEEYPEINLDGVKVGLFGKFTTMDAVLRDKDRVEIYRPLLADPKDIRKQRAAKGKTMKKGK